MNPAQIGRYHLIEKVGSGLLATVYRAYDPNFAREVAVKIFPSHFLSEPLFWQRFRKEVQVIMSLDHPAILTIYDFGEEDGQPFLVMKLMTGGSLADRIAKGPLSLREATRILSVLASALDEAHTHEVLHQTLKPSNIIFDHRDIPYLTDFGMTTLVPNRDTLSPSFLHTAAYISPELARANSALDGRSDLYSLGVILFEMLTGFKPYQATTPLEMGLSHLNEPIPNLTQLQPALPIETQNVIERAMAKDREARYPTATALNNALNELLTGQPLTSPQPVIKPFASALKKEKEGVTKKAGSKEQNASAPRITQKRRSKWLWGSVTILILLAVLAGWAFLSSQSNISAKDGMELLLVPEGEFLMGASEDNSVAYNDEMPQRTVYLDAFWIDKTEVTNAMFLKFVSETSYQTDAEKADAGFTYNRAEENWISTPGANWQHPFGAESNIEGLEDHPVVQVTWYDAQAYCEWAGRRLPTEAEWEKAARGTDGRKHPWGDEAVQQHLVNFADYNFPAKWAHESMDDGYYLTSPVGSYPEGASPFGALDMVGNAWEWVADWYDDQYYKQDAPTRNPTGPAEGFARGLRGGSYSNAMRWTRTSYRGGRDPSTADMGFGFRCAQSAQ